MDPMLLVAWRNVELELVCLACVHQPFKEKPDLDPEARHSRID
jgi:hypothetical protein